MTFLLVLYIMQPFPFFFGQIQIFDCFVSFVEMDWWNKQNEQKENEKKEKIEQKKK